MKTSKKRVCSVCGDEGKVFDFKKWWCALDFLTSHGYCRNHKEKKK